MAIKYETFGQWLQSEIDMAQKGVSHHKHTGDSKLLTYWQTVLDTLECVQDNYDIDAPPPAKRETSVRRCGDCSSVLHSVDGDTCPKCEHKRNRYIAPF